MPQAAYLSYDSVSPCCEMGARYDSSYLNDSTARSLRSILPQALTHLPPPSRKTSQVSVPTELNWDLANRPALPHFVLSFLSQDTRVPPPSEEYQSRSKGGGDCWVTLGELL